jgi:hypothetical protein
MSHQTYAIDRVEQQPSFVEDPGFGDVTVLARPPRNGRDIMLLVAEEPLTSVLLELSRVNGYDAYACETPLDAIDTLVQLGDRVACAFVSAAVRWTDGFGEFLRDQYPHVERILIRS